MYPVPISVAPALTLLCEHSPVATSYQVAAQASGLDALGHASMLSSWLVTRMVPATALVIMMCTVPPVVIVMRMVPLCTLVLHMVFLFCTCMHNYAHASPR